jgi:molybdate transport system regulatory protein
MAAGTDTRWKTQPRWRVSRQDEIALGPGKADLLDAIDRVGSISGAARELGMSYRRAWLLVETMNHCFRRPLVATSSCRRSGAALTAEGKDVLALYRRAEAASLAAARGVLAELQLRLVP